LGHWVELDYGPDNRFYSTYKTSQDDSSAILPVCVMNWLGVKSKWVYFDTDIQNKKVSSLVEVNIRKDFNEIADIIESGIIEFA